MFSPFIKTLSVSLCVLMLSALGVDAAQDSLTRKRRAQEAFINGLALQMRPDKQAEAILEFQQALRFDSSAAIHGAIARSYALMDKNTLALEHVQLAISLDSMLSDTWELQSEILIDLGRYDEALISYERIRTLNPSRRQLYYLGRLYEPRNATKAIEVFEELVRLDPDESIYMRLADLYRRVRNPQGRVEALVRAAALNSRDAEIAAELMDAYMENGRVGEAHALALTWTPSERSAQIWAAGLSRLVLDTLVLHLYQDSVAVMLTELDRMPAKPWQLSTLAGVVAMHVEDTLLAFRFFEAALVPRPSQVEQFVQVASAYVAFKQLPAAYDALVRGHANHADDLRIVLLLGSVAHQMDRVNDALRWFNLVVTRDSTIDDAWISLGMLYDGIGDTERSDAAYERALSLDPDNHLVSNNYAYALAVRGKNLQLASVLSARAVQREPTNASYLDTHAWVLFQLQEFDKAKSYIERAVALGGNATHYEHLGDILEQLGDVDGAVTAWSKALTLDPSRDVIQNKLGKYR